jgi:hypothetical protein
MIRSLVTAVLLAAAGPVLAWSQTGHRVTGDVADAHLAPKARAAVKEILGTESLAEASNWADYMRAAPDPFWQKESSPWHYVTIPVGKTYSQVGAPPEGDAITALAKFAAVLKDRQAPMAERQKALRFIVHIIGDLSQPLHVGRGGALADRGGNDIKVSWFGRPTNLHSVWDFDLVENERLSYSEWTAWLLAAATPAQLRDWSSPDPQQWLADSVAVRETIYPANPDLGYTYVFENRERVRQQLTKGGLRLAAYLNRLFDTP